ncbi:zinc-binding alcohol dehydrogenase [Nocardioides mangrovicus]|uniref:Zinc-binding alcohol dehydrogenase n=1 Tax=Nocardioides mangrovicus TaxID=2478913 RepID=A0A3L8NXV6_9ACTN|nr:alcohol dehydrogenase catalytic domain-containing protein [Nocardioides mangrovicus]RLV47970.1 zinc-binding alcohol dehydrogenase [Nocardioides mangrovicus]
MRASVFHGAGDVRLEEVPDPRPREGEVLLRVLRSGMCGTDATEWSVGPRTFPVATPHPVTGHVGPMVLGHEFVGEVVDPGGSALAAGDVVASGAGVWCGRCRRCAEGRTNLCERYWTLGLNAPGGMAELVAVPEQTLRPVPEGLELDAAGLAQPLAVGLHAARRSGVRDGDRVVMTGAGAIGSFVLAGLSSLARAEVTVVDFAGPRLDRATRLGAARVVPAGPEADEQLREAAASAPVDVVIEASGAPGRLQAALELVRPGGTVLQVGLPKQRQEVDVFTTVMREIDVVTTLAHVCDADLAAALTLLHESDLAHEVLDSVHPLEAVPAQLERLAAGELHGKVLIDPTRVA